MKRLRSPWLWGLMIVVALVGCTGRGGRHVSWPGMTLVDGTIYAANLEHIVALDAETGETFWNYPSEDAKNGMGPFYAKPVFAAEYGDNGMLVVAGFNDKTVRALYLGIAPEVPPKSGWTFEEAQGQYVGSGTIAGGLFLIGNGDGNVYALDLESGKRVWKFTTQDRVWATPLVVDDVVYIASLDHHLYAVDLAEGHELWTLKTGGAIAATPVYVNGSLWIGNFTKTLYQIAPETGEVLWTFTAEDWLWATPVSDGENLYFADVGGHVYALNTDTRALLWNSTPFVEDVVRAQPVLTPDQSALLVAGFEKGGIHEIDIETGVVKAWELPVDAGRLPGDLVTDGERLYLMPVLVKDRVQALDITSGAKIWVYPPESDR